MAPRELFTFAITSEVRLWSMTKAMESGAGSTVNRRNGSRVSFSKILKSRQVRPATSFPFESLTVTGTSTKLTLRTNFGRADMPSPGGGNSGGAVWKLSLPWVDGGRLLGGAWSCPGTAEEELGPVPVVSSPAPFPGVIVVPFAPAKGGSAWGVGASGTAGCCSWARPAGHTTRLRFRNAASDHAFKPSFTGILQGTVVSFQWSVKCDP